MTHDTSRRRRWWTAAALAVIVPVLVFAMQRGECFDAATGAGQSVCSSGPAIGWAGAWALTACCAVLLVLSVVRLLRSRRSAG